MKSELLVLVGVSLATVACGGSKIVLGDNVFLDPNSNATSPDGSDESAFPSVAEALSAIGDQDDWSGRVTFRAGEYDIEGEDAVLPIGVEVDFEAGSTLRFGPGLSMHAQGNVTSMGTEEDPVTFTWLEEGEHWGALTVFEPDAQDNVFEWTVFEHGYEVNFRDIGMRGALSMNRAKGRISNCTFRENEGDDGLNIKFSSTIVENSTFTDNLGDAIDADGEGEPEIMNNLFMNNVNDGVDLGEGTHAYVHDNRMITNGDKGISNGELSFGRSEHNLIVGNGIGIGIKDGSEPELRFNTLYGNDYGVRVYVEAVELGGGKGLFENGIIWGSDSADILFEVGETTFAHSCIQNVLDAEENPIALGEGVATVGEGCDDPLFVDPENLDFHLRSEAGHWNADDETWIEDDETSPCVDLGNPDSDVGDEPDPNGSRVDVGFYGATEEASKSP